MEFLKYLPGIVLTLFISSSIAVIWVNGVNKMNKQHPDYKGEDFLELDDDDKTQIG